MLQEQISEYLGVTSFKRKYPDLCAQNIGDAGTRSAQFNSFLSSYPGPATVRCDAQRFSASRCRQPEVSQWYGDRPELGYGPTPCH